MSLSTPSAEKKGVNLEKKQDRSNIVLIAAFIGFIGIFFLLILFLPKHEGELSPNERRVLAKAPDASIGNIMNGGFSGEVDTWLEDHFPFRNFFVALFSYADRLTGRNITESIILGSGDRLLSAPVVDNESEITKSGNKIAEFAAKNGLHAVVCGIPSNGSMLENALPKLHLEYHDADILQQFETAVGGTSLNNIKLFTESGDTSEYYYRTDHHLTMQGSYAVYTELCKELGIVPTGELSFEKQSFEFYGTAYGSSGLLLTKPDTLEVWRWKGDEAVTVTTYDGSTSETHSGMYDETCLADGYVDRYAAYLYSNHGITVIENPNAAGGSLLVLKDSYGNAIVPFLAKHYKTIVMLDLRYFNSASEQPSNIVAKYGLSDLLVLYGTDSISGLSSSIGWLR